jgi:hypothetical protein
LIYIASSFVTMPPTIEELQRAAKEAIAASIAGTAQAREDTAGAEEADQ